jgi:hypothetical protein
VVAVAAFQRQFELLARVPDTTGRIRGQIPSRRFAADDGIQDGSATLADNVAQNRSELDVGRLQQAADAVDDAVAIALQMSATAGQFAQFAYRLRRHKTASQQSFLQLGGDAFGILLIGLSAGQL